MPIPDMHQLMKDAGVLEIRGAPPGYLGDYPRHFFRFADRESARAHRKKVRCGGWVLGCWLFPGTGWPPADVRAYCPDEGELE